MSIDKHPVFNTYSNGYEGWVVDKAEEDIDFPEDHTWLEEDLAAMNDDMDWVDILLTIPLLILAAVVFTLFAGVLLSNLIEVGGWMVYQWFLS